ncbi:MAG TPA: DNA mismatch repair endonuclease MutL [Clostridiaceae bacterium]|nr:DNA mismatch repair endonuclease MutL [Clostridiaceae bacterium]
MSKIIVLDEITVNRIAAGEVVERPASVVKELVENSLDAGASSITVEIKNGGITYIKVMDNGSGIEEGDVEIAFERHATSKIMYPDDLESVSTMGFRGEALASIAAVSNIELTTRTKGSIYGTYIKLSGGTILEKNQKGCPVGTTIIVKDLFFNTPARYKFLKKDSTEGGYVADILNRIALGNPDVSIKLVNNGTVVLHTPGNNDLLSAVFSVYGRDISSRLIKIDYVEDNVRITGYAGKPEIARSNRNHQSIFVNGRYIKSKIVTSAIDEAYKTLLMKNKFPFIILNIDINPSLVDVNVHPAKTEVRFSSEQDTFRIVYNAIYGSVMEKPLIRNIESAGNEYLPGEIYPGQSPGEGITRDYYQKSDYKWSEFQKDDYKQESFDVKGHLVSDNMSPGSVFQSDELFGNNIESNFPGNRDKSDETAKMTPGDLSDKPEVLPVNDAKMIMDELLEAKIIGQVFSTYILLEYNQEIIIIDQHAAHERIMYESLLRKYKNNETLAQTLLNPVTVELTNSEIMLLEANKDFFNKMGFIFENFGNNSIILRAVPYINSQSDFNSLFLDIIDIAKGVNRQEHTKTEEEALYMMACKAAVKANKKLDNMEVKSLLREMASLDNPYSCPHGRPTMIKMSLRELEKRFKRII